MNELSELQRAVVFADIAPLSVIAAAGSGKTRAAVARLVELRTKLRTERGRVALLSFSNAAVDEFSMRYKEILQHVSGRHPFQERVSIQTLDSFVIGCILTPHGHRVMGCNRTPYLVRGNEPFLEGFKYWVQGQEKNYPVRATTIHVRGFKGGTYSFWHGAGARAVEVRNGLSVTERLGAVGAYVHGTTQYWALRAMEHEPRLARVVARRFPHIVIDEAQDLQPGHMAVLGVLARNGSSVSLFGDPNQAIYEFAGADGSYLRNHERSSETTSCQLSVNYRSTPAIVGLANTVSGQSHTSHRREEPTGGGTFYLTYSTTEPSKAVAKFREFLTFHGIRAADSAVLSRGASLVDSIDRGKWRAPGQGAVAELARATRLRDTKRDYVTAFRTVVRVVAKLLKEAPNTFEKDVYAAAASEYQLVRRLIWSFVRDHKVGLPEGTLAAKSTWHNQLKARVSRLMAEVGKAIDVEVAPLGPKLTRAKLTERPLLSADPAGSTESIRADTVHQAKGEGLDAVLFLGKKPQIDALLSDEDSEERRIGYVAITRARHLFVLGIPKSTSKSTKRALEVIGLKPLPAALEESE